MVNIVKDKEKQLYQVLPQVDSKINNKDIYGTSFTYQMPKKDEEEPQPEEAAKKDSPKNKAKEEKAAAEKKKDKKKKLDYKF